MPKFTVRHIVYRGSEAPTDSCETVSAPTRVKAEEIAKKNAESDGGRAHRIYTERKI